MYSTITVNLVVRHPGRRVFSLVGVNQRQMRLVECAHGILHDLAGL